ncbi:GNAT family N-acetyltransferase [Novosphingobium flavum]|uniref:GNAT family N-acetyltransferase n=1 Tax=Novosphingobium flavum TaxID=1778672 RepID=A0A7X1KMP3_9SPHN|nr:GNAT family N-acetyltransferase [Novosphingobium flavum]MBC2666568.1 GNAT family N-acetyltransferase [Novosphingobium flavum]
MARLLHLESGEVPARGAPRAALRRVGRAELASGEAIARWDALAARASEPNPFFEAWYLLPSLAALDPGDEAEIWVLEDDAEGWLGLIPLARSARYYRYPFPNVANWLHANAFLGAPLVAKGHETAFWQELLGALDHAGGAALFLHLAGLPLDGPLAAALRGVAGSEHRALGVVHREERAMLEAGASAEAYLEAALSGKKRKELRRQHARLSEQGELLFQRSNDAAGLDGWTAQFLALEASGWKGEAGSALASSQRTAGLFRQALAGAAARGRLERLTLSLDGRPIAMLASFITPPGAFSYKTAFAEEFARFSPGVLLQRENLALLERPGIEWCDSCAAADHPMIDHLWRERRAIGRISLAIGSPLRRALFSLILRAERARARP